MANTKKEERDKKKSKTFAITNHVLNDFMQHCDKEVIIPSHQIEKLIIKFNSKL